MPSWQPSSHRYWHSEYPKNTSALWVIEQCISFDDIPCTRVLHQLRTSGEVFIATSAATSWFYLFDRQQAPEFCLDPRPVITSHADNVSSRLAISLLLEM